MRINESRVYLINPQFFPQRPEKAKLQFLDVISKSLKKGYTFEPEQLKRIHQCVANNKDKLPKECQNRLIRLVINFFSKLQNKCSGLQFLTSRQMSDRILRKISEIDANTYELKDNEVLIIPEKQGIKIVFSISQTASYGKLVREQPENMEGVRVIGSRDNPIYELPPEEIVVQKIFYGERQSDDSVYVKELVKDERSGIYKNPEALLEGLKDYTGNPMLFTDFIPDCCK